MRIELPAPARHLVQIHVFVMMVLSPCGAQREKRKREMEWKGREITHAYELNGVSRRRCCTYRDTLNDIQTPASAHCAHAVDH